MGPSGAATIAQCSKERTPQGPPSAARAKFDRIGTGVSVPGKQTHVWLCGLHSFHQWPRGHEGRDSKRGCKYCFFEPQGPPSAARQGSKERAPQGPPWCNTHVGPGQTWAGWGSIPVLLFPWDGSSPADSVTSVTYTVHSAPKAARAQTLCLSLSWPMPSQLTPIP